MDVKKKSLQSLAFILLSITFVSTITFIISLLAKGYRLRFDKGLIVDKTGLLSVVSTPKSASVFINDKLVTATDDTIALQPNTYNITINQDGYIPWTQKILITDQLVTQLNITLFRSSPNLESLVLTSISQTTINRDLNKIAFVVSTASLPENNGIYILDLDRPFFPLTKNSPVRIISNKPNVDWSKSQLSFSPDSRYILAQLKESAYLLDLSKNLQGENLFDISYRLEAIQKAWQESTITITQDKFQKIPTLFKKIFTDKNIDQVQWNKSNTRMLFLATDNFEIPEIITPTPTNQIYQKTTRSIIKDNYYVIDFTEDKIFSIKSNKDINTIFWLPETNNLLYSQEDKIYVSEYDSSNENLIYAGIASPFIIAPSYDGTKIITLARSYPDAPENLYAIGIR